MLKGIFELVVCQKAFNLNVVHKTTLHKKLEPYWKTERGYNTLFRPCARNKAGMCIFENNNLNLIKSQQVPHTPIQKVYYTVFGIKVGEKSLRFANIYSPNEGNPPFF